MRGVFLLEALIALLVFAFATVGLLGVLIASLRDTGNARWRGEAFDIAFATLGRMWAEPPAELAARYDATPDAPGYRMLLAEAQRLPGVSATANAPAVSIEDAPDDRRRVVVTIHWQLPGEADAHRVSASATLARP